MDPPTVNGFSSIKNPIIGKLASYTKKCINNDGFFRLNGSAGEYKVVMTKKMVWFNNILDRWYYFKIVYRYEKEGKKVCTFVKYNVPWLTSGLRENGVGPSKTDKRTFAYLTNKSQDQKTALRSIINMLFDTYVKESDKYIALNHTKLSSIQLNILMLGLRDLILESKRFAETNEANRSYLKFNPDKTDEARKKIADAIDNDAVTPDYFQYNNPSSSQSGGSRMQKTTIQVDTHKGRRCVYLGPRGGKYVKLSGKYVRLQTHKG